MDKDQVFKELEFKAVKSSGAGGQHVNKVATKVSLSFHLDSSLGLDTHEKKVLYENLANRISKEGFLTLNESSSRSQHSNKQRLIQRFFELLKNGLVVPKERKTTVMSKAQKRKRLDNKSKHSEKKELRKKPKLE